MTAAVVMVNTIIMLLNVALIDRDADVLFDSSKSGVSWVNLIAALLLAFTIGFAIHSEIE